MIKYLLTNGKEVELTKEVLDLISFPINIKEIQFNTKRIIVITHYCYGCFHGNDLCLFLDRLNYLLKDYPDDKIKVFSKIRE